MTSSYLLALGFMLASFVVAFIDKSLESIGLFVIAMLWIIVAQLEKLNKES